MKKFFSLVLALVMALSLTTIAWGADVTTSADFANAVEAGGTVTLGADITLTSADWTNNNTIEVYNDVVINLNGWDLNASASTRRPFELYNGANLTIVANGTETVTVGNYGLVYIPDGASDVTLTGGNYVGNTDKGALIKPKGDEAINITLTGVNYTDSSAKNWLIDGTSYDGPSRLTITVDGGSFNVYTGITAHYADITVSDAVFTVKNFGIESGLGSTALVENCTITASGVDNGAAPTAALVASNGGTMTVKGGTYTGSSNASTDGKNAAAIYPTGGSITVESGTLDGDVKMWNEDSAKDYEVTISGGTVTGEFETTATEDVDVTVSGGTFTTADVTDYLAAGLEQTTDGVVKTDISGAKTTYNGLYLKGTNQGAVITANPVSLGYYQANAAKYDKVDGHVTAKGNVAYFLADDLAFNGVYVQVATLAQADVVAYADAAGKVVKFYLDDISDATYFEGVVFNNFGEKCGQVDMDPVVGVTYYTVKGDLTKAVYASAETGSNLMVGGKLVTVNPAPVATAYVGHTVVSEMEDGKLVKVYCSACKLQAVEAPNYMSIPKGADQTGLTGNWYWAGITAGTSTDKVESAETFDAGIAMYVGMSVMAAAGGAVVIGKKKD